MSTDYYINPLPDAVPQVSGGTGTAGDADLRHTWTDYCGNFVYENDSLKQTLIEGGYISYAYPQGANPPASTTDIFQLTPTYHFYVRDHLGNNRLVVDEHGAIEQVNHYYPFGGLMGESQDITSTQRYKYNGKELDRMHGLDWYDYGARMYDPAIGLWTSVDPMAEKYHGISPYAYCGNNPINYIDLNGDSLSVDTESLMAIYNALPQGANITLRLNNGVIDPSSIEEFARGSKDTFVQDLYEISKREQMVELRTGMINSYIMNGERHDDQWSPVEDFDPSDLPEPERSQYLSSGYPAGRSIVGNLGQTLYPQSSGELKQSLNDNIQININSFTTLSQRSIGIAHEFAHVLLFLNNLPHSHVNNADYIYGRRWNVMKRLGYDVLESPSGTVFHR